MSSICIKYIIVLVFIFAFKMWWVFYTQRTSQHGLNIFHKLGSHEWPTSSSTTLTPPPPLSSAMNGCQKQCFHLPGKVSEMHVQVIMLDSHWAQGFSSVTNTLVMLLEEKKKYSCSAAPDVAFQWKRSVSHIWYAALIVKVVFIWSTRQHWLKFAPTWQVQLYPSPSCLGISSPLFCSVF